jgi:TonB family protein
MRSFPVVMLALAAAFATAAAQPHAQVRSTLPKPIKRVMPAKPPVTEDTVLVQVVVDRDGHVRDLMVLRSVPRYDDLCRKAAAQWRFEPVRDLDSGERVEMSVVLPFRFRSVAEPLDAR